MVGRAGLVPVLHVLAGCWISGSAHFAQGSQKRSARYVDEYLAVSHSQLADWRNIHLLRLRDMGLLALTAEPSAGVVVKSTLQV